MTYPLHMLCCCPSAPGCSEGMATSYSVTGIGGVWTNEWEISKTAPCPVCPQGEPEQLTLAKAVEITFTQDNPILLRREDYPHCCYRGRGTITVQYTLRVTYYANHCNYLGCDSTPREDSYEYSGSRTVPVCLEVFKAQYEPTHPPTPQPCNSGWSQGDDIWVHKLTICGFPLHGNVDGATTLGICPAYNFDEPYGTYCTGAHFVWVSEYDDLTNLRFPEIARLCHTYEDVCIYPLYEQRPAMDCILEPHRAGCLPCTAEISMFYGPFGVAQVEEFTDQDLPENCKQLIPSWMSCVSPYTIPYCDDCFVGDSLIQPCFRRGTTFDPYPFWVYS